MTDFLGELWIALLVAVVIGVLGLLWKGFVHVLANADVDIAELKEPVMVFGGGLFTVVSSLVLGWLLTAFGTWVLPWLLEVAEYFSEQGDWATRGAQEMHDAGMAVLGTWRWCATLFAALMPGLIYSALADVEMNYRPGFTHKYLVPAVISSAVALATTAIVVVHLAADWLLGSAVPNDFPMPAGFTGSLPWEVSWTAYLAAVICACAAIGRTVPTLGHR